MKDLYNISEKTIYEYNTNDDTVIPLTSPFITYVLMCAVVGIGLPLTLLAYCGVYCHVRDDEDAMYTLNILISNIILFCCMIFRVAKPDDWMIEIIFVCVYGFSLFTSLAFRVCVSMERYWIITWPLWYRFRRTTNISTVICVMVWTFSFIFTLRLILWVDHQTTFIILGILSLLPLPLFIFFLVGTYKALSTSSVPSGEKRRGVVILVVVLLVHILLFLPAAIYFFSLSLKTTSILFEQNFFFLLLSPLADLFLYVFSRKGAVDKLLSSLCCCIVDNINTSTEQQVE